MVLVWVEDSYVIKRFVRLTSMQLAEVACTVCFRLKGALKSLSFSQKSTMCLTLQCA